MSDTADTLNNSITAANLRGIGVLLNDDEYEAGMHRTYVRMDHPNVNTTMALTSWKGSRASELADYLPYFCPSGWRRFAVKVPSDIPRNFWENSSNMYHGLKPEDVPSIVRDGFRPSECQHQGKAVYMTPSIRYAAHPRYARIQVHKGLYYQIILQCRVLNEKLTKFKDAVLSGGVRYDEALASGYATGKTDAPTGATMKVPEKAIIDDNHSNDIMEFLWFASSTTVTAKHGLVVTGVMVRCLGKNPIDGPENAWWQHYEERDLLVKNYMKRC
jgi:hypothetical protein